MLSRANMSMKSKSVNPAISSRHTYIYKERDKLRKAQQGAYVHYTRCRKLYMPHGIILKVILVSVFKTWNVCVFTFLTSNFNAIVKFRVGLIYTHTHSISKHRPLSWQDRHSSNLAHSGTKLGQTTSIYNSAGTIYRIDTLVVRLIYLPNDLGFSF